MTGQPEAFGSYKVIKRLGGGKQGETFLACDANGRQVAIKTLLLEHATARKACRALEREVAAMKAVSPGFVPQVIAEHFTAERPYYVMEYLDGRTVDDLLTLDAPLSKAELQRLAVKLAVVLDAIHTAGVAHGDFRGQNLLNTIDGIYAIDFGRALLRGDTLRGYHKRRKVDLLRLGGLFAHAGTGRPPYGDEWSLAIEHYDDGQLDLGAMSGRMRTITRALLTRTAWRRPSARHCHHVLIADHRPRWRRWPIARR